VDRTYRLEVIPLPEERPRRYLLDDIAALGIAGVERVERNDLFFLRGDLSEADLDRLCAELLVDPVTQRVERTSDADAVCTPEGAVRVEVGLLHGVTDSVAANLVARAHLLGVDGLRAAATAQSYLFYGTMSEADVHTIVRRLLCNDVIQYYHLGCLTSHVGAEPPEAEVRADPVPLLDADDDELLRLSRERLLSMDLAEMRAVQRNFAAEGREPTDVELESIAQTWSEHCGHKTFKGVIDYTEETPAGPRMERIDSLIRTYLQAATKRVNAPWVRSAFVDNAGIIEFADGFEVSFKAETHNHPSALEPFGGANTGVGGVVRDIMGVSARPIANTDVLCFGPLDADPDTLANGVLHPRRIYNGVVHGVEDYGNKMGIPTVNGAIYFHPGYTANPLVYCGCAGIAPAGSHPRGAQAGDLVVVLGGRTGRDGLHGATFSSIELTDETGVTSGGAVQIGNPIAEKMTLDALLVARDAGLYSAITDCGAGGLSSAVSEMGEETGVLVQLDRVPLKYQGLSPWEIWLSEAQERMVIAVPQDNEAALRGICEARSVEMTVIGSFTGDGRLHLRYGEESVADLSMAFLHGGLPRRDLAAEWVAPSRSAPRVDDLAGRALAEALLGMLRDPNVRSKEDVVRRYDHEVQGGTVVKPLVGTRAHGPGDAAVIRPLDTAQGWAGFALGAAFNPAYGDVDPYAMAISAIDEAVRNVVSVGGDPDRTAILDNFCWGNPSYPDRLGSLVRALKGCYDGALHYRTPFISGKDSLNNEYIDTRTGHQVAIPPSLLISSIALLDDVRLACTADLKSEGSALYLVGSTAPELGGSLYEAQGYASGYPAPGLAKVGPQTARALHRAIRQRLVSACHDCSEGGLAIALAEMAMSGDLGAALHLSAVPVAKEHSAQDGWLLFSESNGRYLVEVAQENRPAFEACMNGLPCSAVGQILGSQTLVIYGVSDDEPLLTLPLALIEQAWRGHLPGAAPGEES